MKPSVLSVEEGIDAICKNLLAKCTPATRNGMLEIAYKLSIGAITSIALTAYEDDVATLFIISDDNDQRRALLEQVDDFALNPQSDSPSDLKSAQIIAFPSHATRPKSGA